jgi:hypothetical protein
VAGEQGLQGQDEIFLGLCLAEILAGVSPGLQLSRGGGVGLSAAIALALFTSELLLLRGVRDRRGAVLRRLVQTIQLER